MDVLGTTFLFLVCCGFALLYILLYSYKSATNRTSGVRASSIDERRVRERYTMTLERLTSLLSVVAIPVQRITKADGEETGRAVVYESAVNCAQQPLRAKPLEGIDG